MDLYRAKDESRSPNFWVMISAISALLNLFLGVFIYLDPDKTLFRSKPPSEEFVNNFLILDDPDDLTVWMRENELSISRSVLRQNLGIESGSFRSIADYFESDNPVSHDPVDITNPFKAWAEFTFSSNELTPYPENERQFVPDFVKMLAEGEIKQVVAFPVTEGAAGAVKGKILFVYVENGWKLANISTHSEIQSGW